MNEKTYLVSFITDDNNGTTTVQANTPGDARVKGAAELKVHPDIVVAVDITRLTPNT